MTRFVRTALAAALVALPSLADEKVTPGFLTLPGTDTKLRVYGTAWLNSWYYFNQNLKENGALVAGSTDPLDAQSFPDRQFGMTAKNSRIGLTSITPSARWGDITTVVELDFAKEQAKNGGANLRHAYLTLGRWTLGYTWSNWIDLDANGSTVDMCGPVGQACNGASRYTQVRYTAPLGNRSRLAISLEQNQNGWEKFQDVVVTPNPPETPPPTAKPDSRYPTVVGAYTFSDTWGHVGLRALGQNYGAYTPANGTSPTHRPNRWGGAVQLSGGFKLGKDLLVASIYNGQGLGEYGAAVQGARLVSADDLRLYSNLGWQAGYTHQWTDRVRSNLVVGGVNFRNNSAMQPQDIRSSANCFVNTFVKLRRNVELGMEYGYEDLRTLAGDKVTQSNGGKSGQNHSNKLQVSLTASF
jgi:hypothetical protein